VLPNFSPNVQSPITVQQHYKTCKFTTVHLPHLDNNRSSHFNFRCDSLGWGIIE